MLLANRAIAVKENLNGIAEKAAWKAWKFAMLNRSMLNAGPTSLKNKVMNVIFKDSWASHRSQLRFADKSFNKMWKDGQRG